MILIFDLDDTLYDELDYVHSGFNAVSRWGHDKLGIDHDLSYKLMLKLLETHGRGKIFDLWLRRKYLAKQAVNIYRHHTPQIELWSEARTVLEGYSGKIPMYLVTDGHKVVQAKKIEALGIKKYFCRTYITHQYGIENCKPSIYCFDLIRQKEKCDWSDLIYIGDNPGKDFVNLNKCGAKTVRVLTGQHQHVVAKIGYEANQRISNLCELPNLLSKGFL